MYIYIRHIHVCTSWKNRTLNNSNGHILRWWRNAAHTRRQKPPIEIWRQDCSQSFSRKSDRSSHRSLRTSQISHRFWSQISHRILTDFSQVSHRFLPTHGWRKSVRNLWFSWCFWFFGGWFKQLGFLVNDLKLRFYLVNYIFLNSIIVYYYDYVVYFYFYF